MRNLRRDMVEAVFEGAANNPRGLQTRVGPSQVGNPCDRSLAVAVHMEAGTLGALHPTLVNHIDERPASDSWRATIGTATHAWLENAFVKPRWLTEQEVTACTVEKGGKRIEVTGHADLYDTFTFNVIDHKVLGRTSMASLSRWGPSDEYRVQAHLYGAGFINKGFRVDQVSVAAWPRDGLASDMFLWQEDYDQALVDKALTRLGSMRNIVSHTAPADGPLGNLKLWSVAAGRACRYCPLAGLCPDEMSD